MVGDSAGSELLCREREPWKLRLLKCLSVASGARLSELDLQAMDDHVLLANPKENLTLSHQPSRLSTCTCGRGTCSVALSLQQEYSP